MKINTDGVLIGAFAEAADPQNILDIGTGTGVIALMLAQRVANAQIDAVEIDELAAATAGNNFANSPFSNRLSIFPVGFERFFEEYSDRKYDLIISNPPFHLNSLESPKAKKALAKHTDEDFFERLIKAIAERLTQNGLCWLVLPLQAAGLVRGLAKLYKLYVQKIIVVHSFAHSTPHREIVCFGFREISIQISNFTIYKAPGAYSDEYEQLLQPYFIAF